MARGDAPSNRAVRCIARCSPCYLVFFLLLFPGIFGPCTYFFAWPLVLETDFSAYIKSDEKASVDYDGMKAAEHYNAPLSFFSSRRQLEVAAPGRQLSSTPRVERLQLIYQAVNGNSNVFTDANIKRIKTFEDKIRQLPSYSKVCRPPSTTEIDTYKTQDLEPDTCALMAPERDLVTNFFFPTQKSTSVGGIDALLVLDGRGPQVESKMVVNRWLQNDPPIVWYSGKGFNANSPTSLVTRSTIEFYRGGSHDFSSFVENELYPLLVSEQHKGSVRVLWWNNILVKHEVVEAVKHDAKLASAALIFVFAFMWLNTRSLWLAGFAMVGILYSFPLTYVIFFTVFGYETMMILNFMALYIIMGIGADDVFIFTDLWAQSISISDKLEKRLAWTYRHAAMAMLVTSCTTAASFFANRASSIVPIREFGTFMGTIVLVNYVIVMTLYPMALVTWEKLPYHLHNLLPCCRDYDASLVVRDGEERPDLTSQPSLARLRGQLAVYAGSVRQMLKDPDPSGRPKSARLPRIPTHDEIMQGRSTRDLHNRGEGERRAAKPRRTALHTDRDDLDLTKESGFRATERFFHNRFTPFLDRAKWPLILILSSLVGAMVYLSFENFSATDKIPQFFDESQNLGAVEQLQVDYLSYAGATARAPAIPVVPQCKDNFEGVTCGTEIPPTPQPTSWPTSPTPRPTFPPTDKPLIQGEIAVTPGSSSSETCPCRDPEFKKQLAAKLKVPVSAIQLDCSGCSGDRRVLRRGLQETKNTVVVTITVNLPPGESSSSFGELAGNSLGEGTEIANYSVTSTPAPSRSPTKVPTTSRPTLSPTQAPSMKPTPRPSKAPTFPPSRSPTSTPTTSRPSTLAPSKTPTSAPSFAPTKKPTTSAPSFAPTRSPTLRPTAPTKSPTKNPTTGAPSSSPTKGPTMVYRSESSAANLALCTRCAEPHNAKCASGAAAGHTMGGCEESCDVIADCVGFNYQASGGTCIFVLGSCNSLGGAGGFFRRKNTPTAPTLAPTNKPTKEPTKAPSKSPTSAPTSPSKAPTKAPTMAPSLKPTRAPTKSPTNAPTQAPVDPTRAPSKSPTKAPTKDPTKAPTKDPTRAPTKDPTKAPSFEPTSSPTKAPTQTPTPAPSFEPTSSPTTSRPTPRPTCSAALCVSGVCDGSTDGECVCNDGFKGDRCDTKACPGYSNEFPGSECNGTLHGKCNVENGECSCTEGWVGADCSTYVVPELSDSRTETINIVWGIKGVDRKKKAEENGNLGTPVYDTSFDPRPVESQLAIMRMCLAFMNNDPNNEYRYANGTLTKTTEEELLVRPHSETTASGCPMIYFKEWLEDNKAERPSFPVPAEKFNELFIEFVTKAHGGYFISTDRVGLTPTEPPSILYIRLRVKSGVKTTIGAPSAHKYYLKWEEYVAGINSVAPPTANKAIQVSGLWARAETETAAIDGTVEAWAISNICAFAAILLFTGNIVVAVLCSVSIIAIVSCLLGFMLYVMGWPFGVVEAISVTIFVGFSVDYCLHLANSYNESKRKSRYGRTKDALTQIGGSVLSASITTVGASVFLLFADIVIFRQFGYVIFANIALSIIYALLFFCPLLLIVGPTGRCGEIYFCCKTYGAKNSNLRGTGARRHERAPSDEDAGSQRSYPSSSEADVAMISSEQVAVEMVMPKKKPPPPSSGRAEFAMDSSLYA